MTYLLDTNVVSEIRKGDNCDPSVAAWWAKVSENELYLSTLVIGEIRKGVELVRARDPGKADALEHWMENVVSRFADRILLTNTDVADEWGRMSAIRPVPVIDALLAATAKVNGLTLVTRNVADVAGLGIDALDPFKAKHETNRNS